MSVILTVPGSSIHLFERLRRVKTFALGMQRRPKEGALAGLALPDLAGHGVQPGDVGNHFSHLLQAGL